MRDASEFWTTLFHILLWVHPDDALRTPEEFDRVVCAELPDVAVNPIMFGIVARNMVHNCVIGKCKEHEGSLCSRKYPRDYVDHSAVNADGYPMYRRRQDGRTAMVGAPGRQRVVDNRHVVPYNPFLIHKYSAL